VGHVPSGAGNVGEVIGFVMRAGLWDPVGGGRGEVWCGRVEAGAAVDWTAEMSWVGSEWTCGPFSGAVMSSGSFVI